MKNKGKRFELRTPDGKVILVLHLVEEAGPDDDSKAQPVEKPEAKAAKPQGPGPREENPPMTDAQKRFLFRILAEKGIETDKAHQHLRELFQVDSLKEVSKLEASRMIERLLEEAKGGADGPPF
jgi:uncharacterized protein (DUF2267 family)